MSKYFIFSICLFLSITVKINAQSAPVQFECNMAVQICETKFNPVDDSVLIWGSFNSWTFGIPMESVSDSLYAISFNLIIDSTYQFKFVNTHGNGVFWEEGPNRELLVPVGGTTFSDYFKLTL